MRRCSLIVLTVAIILGATAAPAAASSLRVRMDPNDSSSNLDIHKVITNLSDTTMYLRLKSWDRFRVRDMRQDWAFGLDAFGTRRIDRTVFIAPSRHGLVCEVVRGSLGHHLHQRPATRPDGKSAACHLPRRWFGHIDRAVRFAAYIAFPTSHTGRDYAPNHGLYRWI